MLRKKDIIASLVLASFSITSMLHAGSFIESFSNRGTGDISHRALEWFAFYGNAAKDGSENDTVGNPEGGGFVVSKVHEGLGAKTHSPSGYGLVFTTKVAVEQNISTKDITSITFLALNSDIRDRFRVVVAINDGTGARWFASDRYFTNSELDLRSPELMSFDFVTDASAWRELTFDFDFDIDDPIPPTILLLGKGTLPADLPNGTLVAAGLFVSGETDENHVGYVRYREFTVNFNDK